MRRKEGGYKNRERDAKRQREERERDRDRDRDTLSRIKKKQTDEAHPPCPNQPSWNGRSKTSCRGSK